MSQADVGGSAAWKKYENNTEPLHWAAALGDHAAVRQMVCGFEGSKMIERSLQDKTQRTPLMRSVMWGPKNSKTVGVLTEELNMRPCPEVVKINQADGLGWTALHHAAASGHMLGLRQLAKVKGLDVNSKDIAGCTPLHVAAQHCHSQASELLIRMKADVNASDAHSRTPLHLAAAMHDKSMHAILARPDSMGNVTLKRTPTEGLSLPQVRMKLPNVNAATLVDSENQYRATRRKTVR